MSILLSGMEFFESNGLNTTNIVDIISAKVWWLNDEENRHEIFYKTNWMTICYLVLLAILLYGLWWMIYVPLNWTRVSLFLVSNI